MGTENKPTKKRIEWIDLAKGFCIALVVLSHIAEFLSTDYPLSVQAKSFRMPLYFILSGLFFKEYDGFMGFLKRKTNKLLIPFVFFTLFTGFLPYFVLNFDIIQPISLFFHKGIIVLNEPIWFLMCLFEVNLLFYCMQWLSAKISAKYNLFIVIGLSLVLGIIGLILGARHIDLLFYTDTALTALPLFAFGWWLFRHTNFTKCPINWIRDLAIIIVCAIIVYFFAEPVIWFSNNMPPTRLWSVYLCGVSGTIMILLISKLLTYVPLISYWGRYSIIVLCTHCPVMTVVAALLYHLEGGMTKLLIVFIITMIICTVLIYLMKRFMPHVTAQKDVIKV